ncbi:DUF4192 domain-containing protein [Planosporangium mesophilum]|uniref:DUF4192 domain-containing protein n=1 Tax=Planosporangium mesophilum TaxID=689768 RepID=A0A8J3WZZ6_9ACTN|nr:DUF4192 domain-containing protein [Planosporangium mesophilum]NJC82117.1 DUF4192 domain-containing protein [Planosporangium mesophilum]GII22161.1 hypothetical protein Pme01_17580 [Planosporangium mesophilum]
MSFPTSRVTLHTPTDLLAAVPYLLGFHPADSVVVVGLTGARVVFTARADLPPPDAPPDAVLALADQLGEVLAGQRVDVALIIGYGVAAAVTRAVLPLRDGLRGYGVSVGEILRAQEGRYWSYLCDSVRCCPADGTPYDVTGTEVAAVATYAGRVALPDRAALEQRLAPVEGAERQAMDRATERAAQTLAADAAAEPADGAADRTGDPARDRQRAGLRALTLAVRRYVEGGRLTDDEVASLSLLVARTDVRDLCWSRVTVAGDRLAAHLELWRDVTRRARADLVAAPATLLGYAAWRSGNGALAWIAVQRALECNQGYALARLLGEALDRALPPSLFDERPARQRRRRRTGGRSTRTG